MSVVQGIPTTVCDVCCGARASWFQPNYQHALYLDNRTESITLCDGRTYAVNPDYVADFRKLGVSSGQFDLVFFDPPHLLHAGDKSWLRAKYGLLDRDNWQADLRAGFAECFRILRPGGTLVFKWSEDQIPLAAVLALAPVRPLFGGRRGKKSHFVVFYKERRPK